jgi:hypothetical protein
VAQVTLYIPDPNPQIPGGTSVNTIPFGSAAYTYVGTIPASLLDPNNRQLVDIAFAPGAAVAGGVWNATTVRIGAGHVPSVLPCPFSFPTSTGSPLGSFLDFTVMYDSATAGPLNWTWVPGSWSPMGLQSLASTPFMWNGFDDVGIYVTFTGSNITGGFHRNPNAAPMRTYATGFEAPTSTACNALFGLVMALDFIPGSNVLSISQSGPLVGDLTMTLGNLSPAATVGWTFVSANVSNPYRQGPFFGIYPDASTWQSFTFPYFPGNPFRFNAADFGFFPQAPFTAPPGSVSALAGITLDVVLITMDSSMSLDVASNVVRYTFQ